jgi:membrane protein
MCPKKNRPKTNISWSELSGSSPRMTLKYFVSSLAARYSKDNISILASGMVYSSLIALVPCITFFVMVFGALGVLDPFLDALSNLLVEVFGNRTGGALSTTIDSLTMNAGSLGAFGMVSFLVTFVLLINKLWMVINRIYRTSMEKNLFKRFLTFLVSVIIGTILMGLLLGMKTKFSGWYNTVFGLTPLAPWQKILENVANKTLIWALILILMMAIPNTTVRFMSALISSFGVTLALTVLDLAFSFVSRQMVSYSIIYGSLSVVFIFLLWLYILWVLILVGVEACFILQFKPQSEMKVSAGSPLNQISNVINMMTYIGDCYVQGLGAVTIEELERGLLITNIHLTNDIRLMENAGLLIRAGNNGDRFVPGKPISEIRVSEIIQAVFGSAEGYEKHQAGARIANMFREGGIGNLEDLTLEDILRKDQNNSNLDSQSN